jgi:hypothetical protein
MRFLRPLESLIRMLQCLFGMLVAGLVIFFAVVRRSNAVCVCGAFVEFGSSLMRVIWHSFPNLDVPCILEPFHFSSCSIMNTCAAAPCFSSRVESSQTEMEINPNGTVNTGEKRTTQCLPSLRW